MSLFKYFTSQVKAWLIVRWLQFVSLLITSPPPIPTGKAGLWTCGECLYFRDDTGRDQRVNGRLFKSFSFRSPVGGFGTYFAGGFYHSPATDANLSQAGATQVFGTANRSYAAHAFIVAGGVGTVDVGQIGIRVTGTSITDAGVRTATDSEVLAEDITTLSADQYLESSKKWIGQITFELYVADGAPTTYALDFNYGLAKYEDFGNVNLVLTDLEVVGRAGANDTGFNVELIHHKATGWTYSAAAFVPGPAAIYDMNTDHVTETDITNGENFAWKRASLNESIPASGGEGMIWRITTGANNAIESMNLHIGVIALL